jgi:hypothetical protein
MLMHCEPCRPQAYCTVRRSVTRRAGRGSARFRTGRRPPAHPYLDLSRSQQQLNPLQNLIYPCERQGAYFFHEVRFVHGDDLRDVNHAVFRQISFAFPEQHVARRFGPPYVGCECA